jgi:hypothetical protein
MRKNSLSIEGERFFEKYGREDSPVWIVNSNREVEKDNTETYDLLRKNYS